MIDFSELKIRVESIDNLQSPSLAERENVWTIAVRTYFDALMAGVKIGQAKQEITAWLWLKVPALGKSQSAIYRQLLRKIERLDEAGHVADKRREDAQKRRAPALSDKDRTVLVQQAVFMCGGLVDFAWQNCVREKLLSAELLARYHVRMDRRQRCPHRIRKQIAAQVAALYQHHVRPHSNSNNFAPVTRDWSGVFAQDIYEMDDKTLDVLCRVTEDENGASIEKEIRCQFLPLIDVKSGKILDFVLLGESNYNSISIRTLITKVCKKYGLPGKFSFERGIWKTGKLLGNNASQKSLKSVENFATRIGVSIHHALPGRARTKIVETCFRLLDRKMYGWPGYIGNDEMHKKFERAKDNGLWTFEELFAHLVEAVEDYNNTPSDSIVKGGFLTPNEVWQNCRRKNEHGEIIPSVKLPPEFEYLLADHCTEVNVREYGVKTSIGRNVFQFYSPELVDFATGLMGQKVNVWFNPGSPETAVATDLKEEKFFPLKLTPAAPAQAGAREDWQMFADASAPHRQHTRQLRQCYSDLKATFIPPFRATMADATARVKAQARSEAKAQIQPSPAQESDRMESREDREARFAARRSAMEALTKQDEKLRWQLT